MDFRLSEQQQMLRKQAREFFEKECPKALVREVVKSKSGHHPGLWRKMADLGWTGLVFPEEYGGTGASFLDLVVLLEEMGHACLPGPYFSTVVLCGLTVLDAGGEAQKKLLPKIAGGDMIMAFALTEPSARYDASGVAMRAIRENGHYIISGTKLFISDADVAGTMLCVARTSGSRHPEHGLTLFLLDTRLSGIKRTPLSTLGLDKQCEVTFNSVVASEESIMGARDRGWDIVGKTLQRAAVGKCADMVGSAAAALEMSVSYAKERVQFGRPIGSLQAIQHYCANMAVDVEASRLVTYETAWQLSQGAGSAIGVSMAKNWVNEACQRVTILGHQVHGGIGFCEDHDMHLYYRRVRAGSLSLGDTASHQKVVAQELLAEQGFFPDL